MKLFAMMGHLGKQRITQPSRLGCLYPYPAVYSFPARKKCELGGGCVLYVHPFASIVACTKESRLGCMVWHGALTSSESASQWQDRAFQSTCKDNGD